MVTVVPAEGWLACGWSYRDTRLTAALMWVGTVATGSASLKGYGEWGELKWRQT